MAEPKRPHVVANLPKGKAGHKIRVALDATRAGNVLDVRVTTALAAHSPVQVPTKDGLSLSVDLIPALRQALADAEAQAIGLGWLEARPGE